jgi:hypothetical protein
MSTWTSSYRTRTFAEYPTVDDRVAVIDHSAICAVLSIKYSKLGAGQGAVDALCIFLDGKETPIVIASPLSPMAFIRTLINSQAKT